MKIEVFTQSAIKLSSNQIIYFDPYKIEEKVNDADYIFITHDHYDHYDLKSIKNIIKDKTTIIIPSIMEEEIKTLKVNYLAVKPNATYQVGDIEFSTVRAYNMGKPFHPKEKNYVGYILKLDGLNYYVMGDTDALDENKNLPVDVCFVPIGGTYTMDYKEASKYINELKPKKVIPIHYGSIVGDISLGVKFKELINKDIKVEIKLKEEI